MIAVPIPYEIALAARGAASPPALPAQCHCTQGRAICCGVRVNLAGEVQRTIICTEVTPIDETRYARLNTEHRASCLCIARAQTSSVRSRYHDRTFGEPHPHF